MPNVRAIGFICKLGPAALAVLMLCGPPNRAQGATALSDLTALRDSSYGGNATGSLESCTSGCGKMIFNHWWINMPSLPGQTSDLIVEGSTASCAARLTLDKTATYTECQLALEKVIKDATGNDVARYPKIEVTREGGKVTLNGKTASSSVAGQRLPQPETKYLFFLKYRPPTDDYYILTSYAITPQGLQAVDEPPHFHLHDGKSEKALMAEVESSISDESSYLRRKRSRATK